MASKAWDARIARQLIRPLVRTPVHPNHVTTLGLAIGLAAAACFATGDSTTMGWGAALYLLQGILDHADGELARATGKTSPFGHTYDRWADLIVKTAVFLGIGCGFRHGPLGAWAIPMGLAAGIAFVLIFTLRGSMARARGMHVFDQPSFAGFELEDILYLIAPLTWFGGLATFFGAAAVGAPAFAAWTAWQWWSGGRGDPPAR